MATARVDPLTLAEAARIMREEYRRHAFFWLYAIQAGDDGPVKLGVAKRPAERIATLQTGNHEQLRGLAAWRGLPGDEERLHERFADARLRGEWFRPTPELLEYVDQEGGGFCDWDLRQLHLDLKALR